MIPMKKIVFSTLILFNSVFLFAQENIKNTLTPEHQEVRGSKINMIPPNNFVTATKFLGYQQESTNSSIMVIDIPGPYSEVSKGLTKEALLTQGVSLESSEQFILNDLSAVLLKAEQAAYGTVFRKYILVFGTEKETMLINGIAPKEDVNLDQAIRKALLSVVYDANRILTPLDAVDFEISTEGTDFVFAKSMSNMLIYNRDGKVPSETNDKASLVIAKAFSKTVIDDKKQFAMTRIKQLPVFIDKILTTEPIEINGLKGYEISAEGRDRKTGNKEQVYQVMLFLESDYYILFGSSEADFDKNTSAFKKLVRHFKLK